MSRPRSRTPIHPYWVLLSAVVLPGSGHIWIGEPVRGMTMQLFMTTLGWITWHLTTTQQSLVGRLAGGLFIYAVSVMDAYRIARLHWTSYHSPSPGAAGRRGRGQVQTGAQCVDGR